MNTQRAEGAVLGPVRIQDSALSAPSAANPISDGERLMRDNDDYQYSDHGDNDQIKAKDNVVRPRHFYQDTGRRGRPLNKEPVKCTHGLMLYGVLGTLCFFAII